ncbi:GTP-binding protein [Actinomadura sp.]|jgi:signal recognition particle receptor subunit beta|uniref:GTP-binding protein n=1 Tax=Actinomadura sp. TaxID=1989 RepID=UPI003360787F
MNSARSRTDGVAQGSAGGRALSTGYDAPPASDDAGDREDGPRVALKILVAGGFGVGKTTLVGAVSEIRPLRTEEALTDASIGVDDLDGVAAKTTTTVAMDFGRITLRDGVAIYLFGTPGQERFWFMWNELSRGALGAVVLADTRRLMASFASIDYFERKGTPFVVAVNCFDDADRYDPPEIRTALDIDPHVPVLMCDARRTGSAKEVLVSLVEHALRLAGGSR